MSSLSIKGNGSPAGPTNRELLLRWETMRTYCGTKMQIKEGRRGREESKQPICPRERRRYILVGKESKGEKVTSNTLV